MGEAESQGTSVTAVNESDPPPTFETDNGAGAGFVPPALALKLSEVGDTASDGGSDAPEPDETYADIGPSWYTAPVVHVVISVVAVEPAPSRSRFPRRSSGPVTHSSSVAQHGYPVTASGRDAASFVDVCLVPGVPPGDAIEPDASNVPGWPPESE